MKLNDVKTYKDLNIKFKKYNSYSYSVIQNYKFDKRINNKLNNNILKSKKTKFKKSFKFQENIDSDNANSTLDKILLSKNTNKKLYIQPNNDIKNFIINFNFKSIKKINYNKTFTKNFNEMPKLKSNLKLFNNKQIFQNTKSDCSFKLNIYNPLVATDISDSKYNNNIKSKRNKVSRNVKQYLNISKENTENSKKTIYYESSNYVIKSKFNNKNKAYFNKTIYAKASKFNDDNKNYMSNKLVNISINDDNNNMFKYTNFSNYKSGYINLKKKNNYNNNIIIKKHNLNFNDSVKSITPTFINNNKKTSKFKQMITKTS